MASTRVYTRSFAGGQLSPEMFGRIDDAKFQSGAASLRNFMVIPTGSVKNRPGFAFVKAVKNSGQSDLLPARLIPFTFSLNQTMVIELGQMYARFHTMGATLQYDSVQPAFQPSSQVTFTVANPAVFTWVANGLANGQSVIVALVANAGPNPTYPAGLGSGPYNVQVIDANTFTLFDPVAGATVAITSEAGGGGVIVVEPNYSIGTLVSFEGAVFYRQTAPPTALASLSLIDTDPNSNLTNYWHAEPADLTYEIPTPFQAVDLFSIHYAQSADVMTLVHPNYPPQQLARLGVTEWTMTPFDFGYPLPNPPQNVSVTASPGYLAKIASVTDGTGDQAGQALFTTVASHTLALGDGVYVQNLTFTPTSGLPQVLDGFYLVSLVPADTNGDLINNQLFLMNYSGGNVEFQSDGTYSAGATIEFGSQIFNITSPYVVQAFESDGVSSSPISAQVSVLNNLDVPGSFNTISWSAVPGAFNYFIYKQFNGLYGFIGSTTALSFVDNNIAPDMSITPGTLFGVFSGAGNFPSAVCYFQQRKFYGGTLNAPQNCWGSNSGTESMYSFSLPSLATDAVVFRVAALQADTIQHIVPMLQLMLLTSESEFAMEAVNSQAITPSTISVNPQSYIGASNVQPTIINISMVYAAARGGHVRELSYAWTVNGYMSNDLSLRAANLFDNLTIVDQAYSKSPWPFVWFVSSNGNLLGLTYIPEEQMAAWHHHDTQGTFQSICCVAEGAEDVLYAVIERTIQGQPVQYVERMQTRLFANQSAAFFVDAGITQTFEEPVNQITGLTWLEGCTVAVLADGGVQTQQVVTNGTITLGHAASTVTVGLPYTCDVVTLPVVMQVDGYGQGRTKNINKAWVKVFQSSGILIGPDVNHLTEIAQRTNEPFGSPPSLQSTELGPVMTTPSWQTSGQVVIRQANPLPLEVVGLTLEVVIGG